MIMKMSEMKHILAVLIEVCRADETKIISVKIDIDSVRKCGQIYGLLKQSIFSGKAICYVVLKNYPLQLRSKIFSS